MSHLTGKLYSNIFLNPLRWERENRYFCLFSHFITVELMRQHIKKGKDGETHKAREGVSVLRNDQAKIEITLKWLPLNVLCNSGPQEEKNVNLVWWQMWLWSNSWMQITNPSVVPPSPSYIHQDAHFIRHKENEEQGRQREKVTLQSENVQAGTCQAMVFSHPLCVFVVQFL